MTTYRDFERKRKREVSFEYLISETPFEPFTTDTYFEQYDQPTIFVVKGQDPMSENPISGNSMPKTITTQSFVPFKLLYVLP